MKRRNEAVYPSPNSNPSSGIGSLGRGTAIYGLPLSEIADANVGRRSFENFYPQFSPPVNFQPPPNYSPVVGDRAFQGVTPIQGQIGQLSSSMMRQRLRVSKACDRCRTQKIKCSGTMPCPSCVKHEKECTYTNNPISQPGLHKKARLETSEVDAVNTPVAPERQALQLDDRYVKDLENRVYFLESLLLSNSKNALKDIDIFPSEDFELFPYVFHNLKGKWRELNRFQNWLVCELCRVIYSDLSEENKEKVQVPRLQFFGWNMSGCKYFSLGDLPDMPQVNLPDDSETYINYFFQEINPLFAIVHEEIFRTQVADYEKLLANSSQDHNEANSTINQARLFQSLLYLIYALAIRFIEFSRKDGPRLKHLDTEAKLFRYGYNLVNHLSFQWESFELIQAWLLITQYLRVTHRQNSVSMALSRAMSMIKSMGISLRYAKKRKSPPYELLKAERIFWAGYSMDRIMSLQLGKRCVLNNASNFRPFPPMDILAIKETWITFPAFAMIQISKIADYCHESITSLLNAKLGTINNEVDNLSKWLDENGLDDDDIFKEGSSDSLSLVKAQVKLSLYDLIICIHGRVMFSCIGKYVPDYGFSRERVLKTCKSILKLYEYIDEAGMLYTPWYLNLLLLLNIGTSAIAMIHGGFHISESKQILSGALQLIDKLLDSPVKDEEGKVILSLRFTMAGECLWALKMSNHILSLRLQQDLNDTINIGIDHGSSEVNQQHFNQLGKYDSQENVNNDDAEKRLNKANKAKTQSKADNKDNANAPFLDESLALSQIYDENMLSNLHWFDQWMDFNTSTE